MRLGHVVFHSVEKVRGGIGAFQIEGDLAFADLEDVAMRFR